MKPWEAFQEVDNKDGRYTCRECGERLYTVMWYRSPKNDNDVEMRGRCLNKKCSLYLKMQTVES